MRQEGCSFDMRDHTSEREILAVKDESGERPIPTVWRPVFSDVVSALVRHDYRLSDGVLKVLPVSADTADHMANYILEYGQTLVELPEQTWDSSVCIWMGKRWDILVDLWTQSEGRSDLVLGAKVMESGSDFVVDIGMVYVP
ncbi:hypothetical protein TUMEXPCC7403_03060 [Tumidithrix helvetica PCC 7403]|uniref:DUF7668 domain-containing protein n=1 Tax=Tumidithrix helvetica TaxID=3457545 RepID=UPI003C82F10B